MANLKHVVTDLHQIYLTEMDAKIKPQLDKSSGSSGGSDEGEKKSDGGGDDNVKKAARQLAYDTRYKARRDGIPLERAFAQSVSNSNASAPVKDAAKAMLFSGPKEEFEVDEATAMAKRGHDETAIRNKIAANTRGGAAADRATALADKPTYGDKVKKAARERLARKQRGDFRNTTSSNPGLHGYGHQSDDPKVKAKQAARGAQRGSAALTPNERKKLNMGDEVAQTGDNLQELKKGDKEMVRVTPKKGYGKGYVRFADRKKQAELRKNPQVQSVTGTNYGEPYEGKYKLKPGENKNTKGDLDGDGTKEPDKHEYAGVKDKAIKKSIAKGEKKKDLKAHFSNWKADLGLQEETMVEVAGEEKQKKITEKSVKNTIIINPELKEAVARLGGEVIDVQEMTQDQLEEYLVDIAAEALAAVEEAVHPSIARIDAINKKRAEEKRAAADADKAARAKSAAAFQAHKKEVLAKGGRPVDALDSWQQKKIADRKAKKLNSEGVDPVSSLSARQQDTERQQAQNARAEVELNKAAAIRQKKKDADERAALKGEIKRELSNSFEPEGESVDERTRYAKETGKDPQTGKPSVKGGNPPPAAMRHVEKELRSTGGLMSSRKKPIAIRGKKKEPGKKGYQGVTPVDRIKGQLARKRAPKPDIGSRFD